ncbi:hypothetical protein L6452_12018 [Arctium lappa]|uniref:Uncharacterized protein n=1 Tax=Arctium lappa TaxID=4217 RepID=A0ACB9DPV1_ARCLA|nr:hypothetical protein L6452_12018 [Arctium lappa]
MSTSTTIILHINRFHNCERCIRKVKSTLRKLGVNLLGMDPERGNIKILTAKQPEAIRAILEQKFMKQVVIMSQDINQPNPLSFFNDLRSLNIHQNPNLVASLHGVINSHEVGEALLRMFEADRLDNVEFTQLNTFRFNFTDYDNHSSGVPIENVDYEYIPPPLPPPPIPRNFEPSTPPIPISPSQGYPWPSNFRGFSSTSTFNEDWPYDCCTMM